MGGDTPVYNAKNILEVPLEVTTFFCLPNVKQPLTSKEMGNKQGTMHTK